MLPNNFKLADLYYGHPGKYILSHKGPFNAQLSEEPIQLGQLSCGCWIILDGNRRVGLMLKKDPDAIIGDYDQKLFYFYKMGEWDEGLSEWWNPRPKAMRVIIELTRELNKLIRKKSSFADQKKYQKLISNLEYQI